MTEWVVLGILWLLFILALVTDVWSFRRKTKSLLDDMEWVLLLTYRHARRIIILVIGMSILIFGFALLFLPGPAFLVIPIGLGILSLEFAWARFWLRKIKEKMTQIGDHFKNNHPK